MCSVFAEMKTVSLGPITYKYLSTSFSQVASCFFLFERRRQMRTVKKAPQGSQVAPLPLMAIHP